MSDTYTEALAALRDNLLKPMAKEIVAAGKEDAEQTQRNNEAGVSRLAEAFDVAIKELLVEQTKREEARHEQDTSRSETVRARFAGLESCLGGLRFLLVLNLIATVGLAVVILRK